MNGRFAMGHALINREGFEEVASEIARLAAGPRPAMVVTPNADHMVMLETNKALQDAYARAALVVPDGMPVVWASRLLRAPVKERVTGSDLMPRLCEIAAQRHLKVFFVGGAPGAASSAAEKLAHTYPGLLVAGTVCPRPGFEFDPARDAAIVRAIRDSDADLVFVCLGAPKQELWIAGHLDCFDKGVFMGVGAAVDFCAGKVRRAPRWMQRSGLEWAYRLCQEPGRLASRYAKDLYFFVMIGREWWRRTNQAGNTP